MKGELRIFAIGETVWRVQGVHAVTGKGMFAYGPMTVSAVVERTTGKTYLLSWDTGEHIVNGGDEQSWKDLFRSKREAQAEADRSHNAWLDRLRRPPR